MTERVHNSICPALKGYVISSVVIMDAVLSAGWATPCKMAINHNFSHRDVKLWMNYYSKDRFTCCNVIHVYEMKSSRRQEQSTLIYCVIICLDISKGHVLALLLSKQFSRLYFTDTADGGIACSLSLNLQRSYVKMKWDLWLGCNLYLTIANPEG